MLFTGGFGKKWPAMNKGVSNEDWIRYVAEKNARGSEGREPARAGTEIILGTLPTCLTFFIFRQQR